jgi:hypothetical protein
MWDYWSGTAGDLLFLPVVVFGLVFGVTHIRANASLRRSSFTALAAMLGAAAGAVSQAAWLFDPQPRLNWMVIRPHGLSPIGWYHAAFLVVASGLLAGLTTELLLRARRIARSTKDANAAQGLALLEGTGASFVLTSAGLFVITVIADSYVSRTTSSSLWTIGLTLAAASVVLGLTWALLGRAARRLGGPILVAILSIVAVLAFSTVDPAAVPMVAVAAAGAGFAGIALGLNLRTTDGRLVRTALTLWPAAATAFVCATAWLSAILQGALLVVLGLLWLILLFLAVVFDPWRYDAAGLSPRWAYLVTAFIVVTAALGPVLYQQPILPVAAITVAGLCSVAVGRVASKRIFDAWEPMVRAERTVDTRLAGTPTEGLRPISRRAWLMATTTGMGAFLALAPLVYESVGEHLKVGRMVPTTSSWLGFSLAFAGGLVLGLPVLVALLRSPPRYSLDDPPRKRAAGFVVQFGAIIALLLMATVTSLLAIRTGWHGSTSVIVVAVAILYVIDRYETTLTDNTVLCFRWPKWTDRLVSFLSAFIGGAALYWALLDGAGRGGLRLHYSVLVFVAASALAALASFVAGGLLFARGDRQFATIYAGWWNIVLNEAARLFILLTVAWIPVFVLTHSDSIGSRLWAETAVATFTIVALALWVGVWSGGRLIQHSYEQRQNRFGGRYRLRDPDDVDPREIRDIVAHAGLLFKEHQRLVQGGQRRAGLMRRRLTPPTNEDFIDSLSVHLAFQVLIRVGIVLATGVGLLALLTGPLTSSVEIRRPMGSR